MKTKRTRFFPLKVLAGLTIIFIFSVVGFRFWVKSVESRKYGEMERTARDIELEALARSGLRPVLRGQPLDGNAWDEYAIAIGSSKAGAYLVSEYMSMDPKADRVLAQQVVEQHAPAIAAMRQGVQRVDGNRPIDWKHYKPILPEATYLAFFALGNARFLEERGELLAAAELTLDVIQFGADLQRNSARSDVLMGTNIQYHSLAALRRLVVEGQLTHGELSQIAGELRLLDLSFPSLRDTLRNHVMQIGYEYLREDPDVLISEYEGHPDVSWSWFSRGRFLWSARLMMVHAYEAQRDLMLQIAPKEPLTWAEVSAHMRDIQSKQYLAENILLRYSLVHPSDMGLLGCERMIRDRRARLRLLLGAAHYRATGETPVLEDPFGGQLRYSSEKSAIRIWSVGVDGVDDCGIGNWQHNGKDIVLEVVR